MQAQKTKILREYTVLGLLLCLLVVSADAQKAEHQNTQTEAVSPSDSSVHKSPDIKDRHFVFRLARDQQTFWTSGKDLRRGGAKTLIPFTAFTAALIASDSWLSRQVPNHPEQVRKSREVSNAGVFSLVGATGGSLLLGKLSGNEHWQEAGLLSSEAMLNSTAVTLAFKGLSQRQRPDRGNGQGDFFHGGGSFPSEHAALAWSAAGVLAHEYPKPFTRFLAYGLAASVTVSRVTAQKHFPSDVVVGSALGWYLGRQIYRAHHDPQLGGAEWGGLLDRSSEQRRSPENMGSPPVPLDSWVYAALDRLAAFGYITTAYSGMRPWTRIECARLLEDADERIRYEALPGSDAEVLYHALANEFSVETASRSAGRNLEVRVDSIYSRVTAISGTPLHDGYHFGQTIINDDGRPYSEGVNNITGVSAHAGAGPLAFFLQGEYQHAPGVPSDPASVLQATAQQDLTLPLANGVGPIDRFRLLRGSVAFACHNVQISFGKQSLWLGPGESGPFLYSDNAEPIPMFRIDQVSPVHLPLISRVLGPVRAEFFLGRLSGQHWIFSDGTLFGPNINRQPFIHGSKISFRPTSNFEFGMGFTVLFAGPGLPFTWHNFLRTFTSFNVTPGSARDPGDRRSTFDLSYRIPYLRHWLTLYADSLVDDEFSPLGSTRPSMRMGMYFSHLPKFPKLDLRLEGLYTDVPGQKPGGFLYWNGRYRSGYTNEGNLLASWIGRQGRGGQAWATYWLSARSKLQLNYRHAEVDQAYIGGGHLHDIGAKAEIQLRPDLQLSGSTQYEQWRFPVLSSSAHSNFSASVQMTLLPHWKIGK